MQLTQVKCVAKRHISTLNDIKNRKIFIQLLPRALFFSDAVIFFFLLNLH